MNKKPTFLIRASAIADIKGGTIGLTSAQQSLLSDYELREHATHKPLTDAQRSSLANLLEEKKTKGDLAPGKQKSLDDYLSRKDAKYSPLTDNQREVLAELRKERDNPQPTEGMITYCLKWIKQYKWKRYKEIKSKYIRKGNATEQLGFNLMVRVLKLGMVRSQTERFINHYSNGICDLHLPHLDLIIDNKSSWDWETFPFGMKTLPKKDARYEDQIQGYMEGYDCENGAIVYTLIDCPIDILGKEIQWELDPNKKQEIALNLVYTREYWDVVKTTFFPDADEIEFVEIPEHERVVRFDFKRDRAHAAEVERRVKMCQEFINDFF